MALTVTEYAIPGTGADLTLAVVADLHNRRGEETAARVLALSPDACLFVGDLFEAPPRRRRFAVGEPALFAEPARRTARHPVAGFCDEPERQKGRERKERLQRHGCEGVLCMKRKERRVFSQARPPAPALSPPAFPWARCPSPRGWW